jgi:hypothetical protein
MKRFHVLVAFAVLALLPVAASAQVAAMVSGGGTADFQDTPNAVNTSGYTNFGVGVTVYEDGTAIGEFMCSIPGIVAIAGDVMYGWVNGDDSVTVVGLARGWDSFIPGPFSDLPFMVTFRNGGPGEGGFDYRDESGFFGPGQFDTEVVRRGLVMVMLP